MAKRQQSKPRKRVAGESPSLRDELVAHLRLLAPQAFAEDQFDFAKLRELLGEETDDRPERFSFTWSGRRDAVAMLHAPTRATLVPDTDESINFTEAQHTFIEGENLETLKVVYRAYFGRVKAIYIDPPYNTGNDFIYPDNFADPLDQYFKYHWTEERRRRIHVISPRDERSLSLSVALDDVSAPRHGAATLGQGGRYLRQHNRP